MPRGDGHDGALPLAVQLFAAPPVRYAKVLIHIALAYLYAPFTASGERLVDAPVHALID